MLADDNFTENFAADVPVGIFQYVSNNISCCFGWQIYHLLLKVITQQTFVGLEDVFKTCLEDIFNTSSA